jgi:hypothetical protein
MSSRETFRRTVACAVVLLVGAAASAQAQDATRARTTSQQRIRVSKSSGEVTLPRVSAREQAHLDSIARADQMRRDSIANVERMRQDSINAESARLAAIEKARQDSIANIDWGSPPVPPTRPVTSRIWDTGTGTASTYRSAGTR